MPSTRRRAGQLRLRCLPRRRSRPSWRTGSSRRTSPSTSGRAATSCSAPCVAGEMFNQVAVFESPKAWAGIEDWGTPDELDAGFEGKCSPIQKGLPLMWRDRWWRMFDRDPIMSWVKGRIALLGDAAHPPLQYMAEGAIMAIEERMGARRAHRPAGGPSDRPFPGRRLGRRPGRLRGRPPRTLPTGRRGRPRLGQPVASRRREVRAARCDPAGAEHLRLLTTTHSWTGSLARPR